MQLSSHCTISMIKKLGFGGGLIAALIGLLAWLGGEGFFALWDKGSEAISSRYDTQIAAIQEFVSVNNNDKHYSYALNNPVEGDTLYVHWKWAKHTGGEYCYYYTVDGADVDNSYFHARIPGKCNPKGFSLANQPPGFGFNSSIGVKLPFKIPSGNYTITYYHLEYDGYHDKYQKWVTFNPIPFLVASD